MGGFAGSGTPALSCHLAWPFIDKDPRSHMWPQRIIIIIIICGGVSRVYQTKGALEIYQKRINGVRELNDSLGTNRTER